MDGITGFNARGSKKEYYGKKERDLTFREVSGITAHGFGSPDRIIKKQIQEGISKFFVPFNGDPESQEKLELICKYMNDPTMSWESIAEQIEKE